MHRGFHYTDAFVLAGVLLLIFVAVKLLRLRPGPEARKLGLLLVVGAVLLVVGLYPLVGRLLSAVIGTIVIIGFVKGFSTKLVMFCPSCSEVLPGGSGKPIRFCPYCGAAVGDGLEKKEGPPPDPLE